jgi:replicative DNA helicase
VEVVVAKQRNGPIGEIPMVFLSEYTRFESRSREWAGQA